MSDEQTFTLTRTQIDTLLSRIQEPGAMPANTRDGLLLWLQNNLKPDEQTEPESEG
jgi:hypothetical protein